MSTPYHGLCIGGPMAGKQASSQSSKLKVTERPPPPRIRGPHDGPPEPLPADCGVKDHTYNWLHTGGFGLWIIDGMNLNQAMEEMALAYIRVHGGK